MHMPPRRSGSHARSSFLATLTAAAALALACRRGGRPPYTPADSLKTVRLEAGLRIEPFVSEPAIASPVAMEFDERGRIFVVEMPGYPLDTRPTGRVKLLEDRDHDGRYETVTVFADNLVLPTGVMRWKRGILVTAAPDLKRNPDLLLRSAMQDVSDHGAAAMVYPITRHAEFEMLSEPGQFTSACSLTFVPGGPLATALGRSSLVAEPAHNLVHRDVWSPSGSTFVARRAEEGREFLAAGDAWFRPVNFAAG